MGGTDMQLKTFVSRQKHNLENVGVKAGRVLKKTKRLAAKTVKQLSPQRRKKGGG